MALGSHERRLRYAWTLRLEPRLWPGTSSTPPPHKPPATYPRIHTERSLGLAGEPTQGARITLEGASRETNSLTPK